MPLNNPAIDTAKIDILATDGLLGVENSLAYRTHGLQVHHHSYEWWLELASVPSGEMHIADRIGDGGGQFVIDAGNDDWGNWVQVIGSSDTPVVSGMIKFDLHRIEISNAERNAVYFFQLAFGETGAAALTANTYTEAVFKPATNQVDSGPVIIQIVRQDAGTKVWARCKCPGQDTAILNFFLGLHEYQG